MTIVSEGMAGLCPDRRARPAAVCDDARMDPSSINRALWDERAPAHAASVDYAFGRFAADPTYLSDVVRFDLPRLGPIDGLDVVHLQCHIGTDTVSLGRLGGRVTGLDFSASSLAEARRLAALAGVAARFVESDVYAAADVLGEACFDLVFTGIGALCWLPDIRRWARLVAALLRPGGRLHLREGHPLLWALDDVRADGLLAVEFPYFEQATPTVFAAEGTYVETDVTFTNIASEEWNHGLGEIVSALLEAGMELTMLVEHDSVPWEALPGMMERVAPGEWRLRDRPERVPCTYTLQAVRRAGAVVS
jgi:SAM-dependent methyltransferase